MSEKVLIALSGGVDSAVAAALLKKEGQRLVAVTMTICDGEKTPSSSATGRECYGTDKNADIADARRVADYLDIPFHVLDLSRKFEKEVLSGFIEGYRQGCTPNPCIRCNARIKFEAMIEEAKRAGLDFHKLATGHYARTEFEPSSGRYLLKKGKDIRKDQSYFLSFLNQKQLGRAVFPLGAYTKMQVRKMAQGMRLPVSEKRESQDFASGGYQSLLPDSPPGPIVDIHGKKLGVHAGISHYTIGQHKGMNLPGQDKFYVLEIIAEENTLVVGTEADLLHRELTAGDLNWIAFKTLAARIETEVKIRSGAMPAKAWLEPRGETVRVIFDEPQKGIAPGQAAVFYRSDTVLGAGIIYSKP